MAEEKRSADWLDDIFPRAKQQREIAETERLRFAQNYLVFHGPTSDPRARALLEHWTKFVRRTRPRPEEVIAHNAIREWVEGIQAQIELASAASEPEWLSTTKDLK